MLLKLVSGFHNGGSPHGSMPSPGNLEVCWPHCFLDLCCEPRLAKQVENLDSGLGRSLCVRQVRDAATKVKLFPLVLPTQL